MADPTPNRFISQAKTVEDVLANQTVGLVNLSDFRKRRAEALEQKERDAHELLGGGGRVRESDDGTPPPKEPLAKKKKRKIGTPKLSFGIEDEDGEDSNLSSSKTTPSQTPRSGTPSDMKKKSVNSSVQFIPKTLTKSALQREAADREALRKEFLAIQEAVKATEIEIPFVFYDGTNIPGGVVKVKKGDYIWVFLDRSRKVGAELGVGKEGSGGGGVQRQWAKIGVDDLMVVRGSLIIPHHYDFYYFIINHTLGPNNRILFDYSSQPSAATPAPLPKESASIPDDYNPLSRPSKTVKEPSHQAPVELEGANDDPTFTKVVDRRWYERNKHIFPASVWQDFDPEKDYQKEVKRDAGGNTFFFS